MSARIIIPLTMTDSNLIEGGTTIPEDDAPAWDVGTEYAENDTVIRNHVIYISLIAANTGNDPATDDGTNWFKGLATNRWKAFDGYLQDAAVQADSMAWQIETADLINGVALLALEAATVRVVLDSHDDGVVYDQSFEMADESHITDYDLWFFAPQIRATDFAVTDLPPYPGTLTVTLADAGNTVKLGQLSLGSEIDLGITLNGFDQDLEIFSDKGPDQFGRVSAVKRASSDILEPRVKILTARVPYLRSILKKREALPTVYLFDGPTRDNEYIAFGDFERLRTNTAYGLYSDMTITIREFV